MRGQHEEADPFYSSLRQSCSYSIAKASDIDMSHNQHTGTWRVIRDNPSQNGCGRLFNSLHGISISGFGYDPHCSFGRKNFGELPQPSVRNRRLWNPTALFVGPVLADVPYGYLVADHTEHFVLRRGCCSNISNQVYVCFPLNCC